MLGNSARRGGVRESCGFLDRHVEPQGLELVHMLPDGPLRMPPDLDRCRVRRDLGAVRASTTPAAVSLTFTTTDGTVVTSSATVPTETRVTSG